MSGEFSKIDFAEAKARFEREAILRTVPTGRYRARTWTWGSGPDLLLIHGMADRSDSFLLLASALSRHFRCIGYDLPGAQAQDGARLFRYHHHHLVQDAIAVLDAVNSQSATVLGSSFGSTIAQKLLLRYPHRFLAGILQGGFAYRPIGWKYRLLAALARFAPKRPLIRFRPYPKILKKVHGPGGFDQRGPEVWDWFLRCVGDTVLPTLAHQALMISGIDHRPLLKGITQPVLIISGELDKTVDERANQPLLDLLPRATHERMAQCGHVPCYTHPEKMAEIILQFYQQVVSPTFSHSNRGMP